MSIKGTWTLVLHEQPEFYPEVLEFLKLEEVRYRTINIIESCATIPLLVWSWSRDNHEEFWSRFDQQFEGLLDEGPLLQK